VIVSSSGISGLNPTLAVRSESSRRGNPPGQFPSGLVNPYRLPTGNRSFRIADGSETTCRNPFEVSPEKRARGRSQSEKVLCERAEPLRCFWTHSSGQSRSAIFPHVEYTLPEGERETNGPVGAMTMPDRSVVHDHRSRSSTSLLLYLLAEELSYVRQLFRIP
jgi:hypothetical protein